ncbi:hypothetical protein Micbo1qcDRAFT_200215 [Microdochium bolleyi]|uniref:Uncharacterized protein n=1 Tax=Microdochium bolleyi TaxID=196109 RepID=A0A136JK71_9PEZI|nr:hypothetical protein Micbo1qcDRAFT_200215 [Microdochium bolleyi]
MSPPLANDPKPRVTAPRPVTVSDHIDQDRPLSQKPPQTRQPGVTSNDASAHQKPLQSEQTPSSDTPKPPATPPSEFQKAGPGFQHSVSATTTGWNCTGIHGFNPSSGHQPFAPHHQTAGFPAHTAIPSFFPHPSFGHLPPGFRPNMADYSNCAMPNQGQHFQPPVPDTTYGGMVHTWHPRFDGASGPPQYMVPGQPMVYGTVPMAYPQYQPAMASAPMVMQPMMTAGHQQPVYYAPGQPGPFMQPAQFANAQNPMFVGHAGVPAPQAPPDIMGIGKTGTEAWYEQCYNSQLESNKMSEPQDFKPADPDPGRMYPCREVDGAWTQRNLVTIERLDDARWYIDSHGRFYAVRSAD